MNKKERRRRVDGIACVGVFIAVTLGWILEGITDFDNRFSYGVGLVIVCVYGLVAGLTVRFIAKAIVRRLEKRESTQQS